MYSKLNVFYRLKIDQCAACAIPYLSGDKVVITGGRKESAWASTDVYVFSEDGTVWEETMGSLNLARSGHGCSSYIKEGKWVKIDKLLLFLSNLDFNRS